MNVNSFTLDYELNVGAAGAVFPRPKTYYFSIDSGRDAANTRQDGGRPVPAPLVDQRRVRRRGSSLVTRRVAAGRPTIVVRVHDPEPRPRTMSGIDPTLARPRLPRRAPRRVRLRPLRAASPSSRSRPAPRRSRRATCRPIVVAADYQETKNIVTPGGTSCRTRSSAARPHPRSHGAGRDAGSSRRRRVPARAGRRSSSPPAPPPRISSVRFLDGEPADRHRQAGERRALRGGWMRAQARRAGTRCARSSPTPAGRGQRTRTVRVCR